MRLTTLHKRARRKLFGKTLPPAHVRLVALCNRFAASVEGRQSWLKDVVGNYRYPVTFRTAFYDLKDRIMDVYGRPKGYTLQRWTSRAYDYGSDYESPNGASHEHILERVKVGRLTLHRPTNHFRFKNHVSDYFKETVGFDDMKARCGEVIEGRKRVTRNVPEKAAAIAALNRLGRRYGRLPEVEKPRPCVKSGDRADYFFSEESARQSLTLSPTEKVALAQMEEEDIPF